MDTIVVSDQKRLLRRARGPRAGSPDFIRPLGLLGSFSLMYNFLNHRPETAQTRLKCW